MGELSEMWEESTGRSANEMLEQLVQDFLHGFFESGGKPETIAESENERVASDDPVFVSVEEFLRHTPVLQQEKLDRVQAATRTIKDWERMGEHGRIALRMFGGLRLVQRTFHRWYQTAHRERSPTFGRCPTRPPRLWNQGNLGMLASPPCRSIAAIFHRYSSPTLSEASLS